jgi:hypothetical protein
MVIVIRYVLCTRIRCKMDVSERGVSDKGGTKATAKQCCKQTERQAAETRERIAGRRVGGRGDVYAGTCTQNVSDDERGGAAATVIEGLSGCARGGPCTDEGLRETRLD